MLDYTTQGFAGLLCDVISYDGAIIVTTEKSTALGIGGKGDADTVPTIKTLGLVAFAVQSTHLAIF